jgi:hypothetical protein
MLCKNQTRTDEPCPGGLSRKITCGKGHGTVCMKECNAVCSDFDSDIRPKPAEVSGREATAENHLTGTPHLAGTPGKKCGGCGSNANYLETTNSNYQL